MWLPTVDIKTDMTSTLKSHEYVTSYRVTKVHPTYDQVPGCTNPKGHRSSHWIKYHTQDSHTV